MNHKRRRPKNARAGCLLCKPHKANGAKEPEPVQARRVLQAERVRDHHGDYVDTAELDMQLAQETCRCPLCSEDWDETFDEFRSPPLTAPLGDVSQC